MNKEKLFKVYEEIYDNLVYAVYRNVMVGGKSVVCAIAL